VPGHGRQYYRLPSSTLYGNDAGQSWPLESGELDQWYDRVEAMLQLQGSDNVRPDSLSEKQAGLTAAESDLRDIIHKRWPDTNPVLGQHAPPLEGLSEAAGTGRLNVRQGAIVKSVDVDEAGRLKGVTWFDCEAGHDVQARAPIAFVCASALESTRILMNSQSKVFPEGIGAGSGVLGRYLMDHIMVSGEGAGNALPSEPVPNEPGRCIYVPRFDQREEGASSTGVPFGVQLYRSTTTPGRSQLTAVSFAEMAPRAENRVTLHPYRKDAFGIPLLEVDCRHDATNFAVAKEQAAAIREIAAVVGVDMQRLDDQPATPGAAMHECGTVRMGASQRNSVLDSNNQVWDVPGLYVTDGGCFPSQGAQNPTLTIMALTARACAHAVAGGRTSRVSAQSLQTSREFAE
jgi:choline dehydrogenase-like flavoprotein